MSRESVLTKLLLRNHAGENVDINKAAEEDICRLVIDPFIMLSLGSPCLQSQQYIIDQLLGNLSSLLQLTATSHHFSILIDRQLLMDHCKYFRSMFEMDVIESRRDTVELHDIELIDFLHLYHHMSVLQEDDCQLCGYNGDAIRFRLIDTCIYLQEDTIYNYSMTHLLKHLSSINCFDAMLCAFKYSHKQLFSTALRFSLFYFSSVLNQKQYLREHVGSSCSNIVFFYLTHPMLNRGINNVSCETVQSLTSAKELPNNVVSALSLVWG